MKKFKLPTVPAIVAICLLAVVFSCRQTKYVNGSVGLMPMGWNPTDTLHVEPSNIGIGDPAGSLPPLDIYGDIIKIDSTSEEAKMWRHRMLYSTHVPTEIHIHGVDTTVSFTIQDNVDYKIGHPCPANKLSITNDTVK